MFVVMSSSASEAEILGVKSRILPMSNEAVRTRVKTPSGWLDFQEFFVRERWNIYEYPDPADKPSTLPDQLRWLEEAGFEGVDVFWARAGHALLGGYRPSAESSSDALG